MRFYLVILGSAISVYATVPYILSVYHAKVKPRLVTWLTWAAAAGIAGIASYMDHELAAAIFALVVAVECAAVVIIGANDGDRTWDNVDIGCLSGAILALCSMFIINSALIAIIFAILTYCFSSLPTYQQFYRNPKSEKIQTFAITALAELIVLGAVNFHSFTGYAFIIYLLLEDLILIGLISFGPKMKTDMLPAVGLKKDTAPYQPVPTAFMNEKAGVTNTPQPDLSPKTFIPTPAKPETAAAGPAVPPTATFSLKPAANKYGWNNSEVTITFKSTTSSTSITTEYCTPPVRLSKEGSNQRITGTAIDSNNTTSHVVASVNIDFTPPQVSNLQFSANPIISGQTTHISFAAVDTLAGVLTGEYFVGKQDPGVGKGHLMTLQGNILSTFLRYDWAPGTYPMSFRAQDLAGNWSQPLSANLIIQAPQPAMPASTLPNPPKTAATAV